MKWIKTFESHRNSEKVNEEFIGNFLKGLVPNWLKNINIKNSGKIDKAFSEYEEKYKQASKDLSAILDSKGEIDRNKLDKIQSALVAKRNLLTKELNRKLSLLTKDNEKSKNYADYKRNAIDMKLIDFELDQYQQSGIEENEYIKTLKNNTTESKKKKEEAEKQLKRDTAKELKKETSKEVTADNLTPGEVLLYRNKKNERSIVKILDDLTIQRISTTINKKDYDEEIKKPEDQRNLVGLFKKEDPETGDEVKGTPFEKPHDDDYGRLTRISAEAQNKFK